MTTKNSNPILLELSPDEALVLFEWLVENDSALPIKDPAEQEVLWRLQGRLESSLLEPLTPGYKDAIEFARKRVRKSKK